MRNGLVFFKPLFYVSTLALITVAFFSSCQKTSTSTANIGDWAYKCEIGRQPRTQAASFLIGNGAGDTTLYVGGGYNGFTNLRLTDFYAFDEATLTTTPVDSFPGDPRNGAACFTSNGKGYVVGGYDGTYYLNDVWQFDPIQPAGSQWSYVGITNFGARAFAVGFTIGNYGYLATGADSTGYTYSDIWRFDGTTNTWANTGNSLQAERSNASVFVYGNEAYIVGGVSVLPNSGQAQSYLPDLSVYNPANSTVTYRRDIINNGDSSYEADYGNNITRYNGAICVINDTAYFATGNYNGIIGTTWAYDIGNDQWFQKTSFEGTAREGAIGFSINNHGYIGLGDNGSNYFNDVWEFFPDAAQTNNDNYP